MPTFFAHSVKEDHLRANAESCQFGLFLCRLFRWILREGLLIDVGNYPNSTLRKRKAFATTETELKLMAALAMMGLSKIPKNG